jgi:hypothetical protein
MERDEPIEGRTLMLDVQLLRDQGIVIITPNGKLQASDFERVGREVDPFIDEHGMLRGLLIHATAFPGWSDFTALTMHIRFVRDHHRKVARIATVSDSAFLEIMPKLAKHFIAAEIRHFPADDMGLAIAWLEGEPPTQTS